MLELSGETLSPPAGASRRRHATVGASQQISLRLGSPASSATTTSATAVPQPKGAQLSIEQGDIHLGNKFGARKDETIRTTTRKEYDLECVVGDEEPEILSNINSPPHQHDCDDNCDIPCVIVYATDPNHIDDHASQANDAKSRDFTFFSVPNVRSSGVPAESKFGQQCNTLALTLNSSSSTSLGGGHRPIVVAQIGDDDDLNSLESVHISRLQSSVAGDNRQSTKKCFSIYNGENAKNADRQSSITRPQQIASSAPNSAAGSPIPDLRQPGGPFEIIQIVPPTNRRNSGALSPINIRTTSNTNRRFMPTNFRSIPELTSAQLNLNRSEQFQASASYALAHCNEEILCYYNRLVSLIGWRPLIQTVCCRAPVNWLIQTINYLYVAIIVVLLLSAYLLQFAACFRQDSIFVYDPLILADESPPFFAYFDRHKTSPSSTTVSWLFRSPNSSAEEFPVIRPNVTSHSTGKTTTTTTPPSSSSADNDDFNTSMNGVTFRGKLFPIIITAAPPPKNRTDGKLSPQGTMEMVNENLLSVFYPFIERYSNVSFHNTTPTLSHHHEHLYRCRGGIGTYYVIPSLLHFIAFVSMLRQMRRPETDRFHNLCVVNYILDTKVSGRDRASNKLTSSIRFWMLIGILSLSLTIFSHGVHLYYLIEDPVCFTFLQPTSDLGVNILKACCLILFGLIDFVCIAIFTTYALHCTLNIHFLKTNITALREKRIDFHEFAKNTEESKTSIDFLNCTHSIGVSILLVHFGTRLLVLLIDLCTKKTGFNLLTGTAFLYWIALVIVPMIQAARVTEACIALRHIGHELRARPFCYQSAPYHDLDSLLNYTSTLHMRAKLLLIPVRSSCVATIGLTLVFVFLILGQIDLIQF